MRVGSIIAVAVAVLAIVNGLTIWSLLRLHPRRRSAIVLLAIIGNLMWLFFPMLRTLTPAGRLTRAIFGPPWFCWQSFAILYAVLIAVWRSRSLSRAFISLCAIGGIAGMYDALVPLRVERVPVYIPNLPPAAEGMRVAELGDLHVGLFTRRSRLKQFFETANTLRPDVVVLAGDLVDDDPYFEPKMLEATRYIDPRTPILAVLGNHEMYGDPYRAIRAERGSRVRLLVNEGMAIKSIWFAGLSDFAAQRPDLRPNFSRALAGMPAGTIPIVVAHQPKAFDEARARTIPLTIVAHTHGGQFGFRPLRWSLAGVFLPYHMGLYQRGASQLYVNTGTGFWLVPFRLGMTGEITLFELHAARSR